MTKTTERRRRRRTPTARTRILGWILAFVTAALLVIIVVTGQAMFSKLSAQATAELRHEAEKFRSFAEGNDPATGKSFQSVDELLTSYLTVSVAEQSETFFSIVDGEPDLRSRGEPPVRLDLDAGFVKMAADAESPLFGTRESDAGTISYAVIPVTDTSGASSGSLVIAEFLGSEQEEAWATLGVMTGVAVVALVLAAVCGWVVAGRVLAPIREVQETAARISDSDLDRRIDVDGDDDVAQLAVTFNRMLDRLQESFAAQRRFLNDAGHELRTPISVIRGHLDVMGDDPDERRETIRLVTGELDRMGRLVDDLIMLARSERPDFVQPAPADLTDLVVGTLSTVTALGERHWAIDAAPEGYALLDGQRIAQALIQLISNAVDHTEDGDRIAVGGKREDGRLIFWVDDAGSGITEEDQKIIFERFRRGSSENREHGTGLGLAIVSRIAQAHGGTVTVASRPGHGATFTIDVPDRPVEETP